MKRKALIKDGKILDIIVADDQYKAPPGFKLAETNDANIGDLYDNGRFLKPKIKVSRKELLHAAHIRKQLDAAFGMEFELDSGAKIRAPTDVRTRQEAAEIASLGIDAKFVFPGGAWQYDLTANDFRRLVRAYAERTAANYAALADVVVAIDRLEITSYEDIEDPGRLKLREWPK
jgi:hypothetical protein